MVPAGSLPPPATTCHVSAHAAPDPPVAPAGRRMHMHVTHAHAHGTCTCTFHMTHARAREGCACTCAASPRRQSGAHREQPRLRRMQMVLVRRDARLQRLANDVHERRPQDVRCCFWGQPAWHQRPRSGRSVAGRAIGSRGSWSLDGMARPASRPPGLLVSRRDRREPHVHITCACACACAGGAAGRLTAKECAAYQKRLSRAKERCSSTHTPASRLAMAMHRSQLGLA